MLRKKANSKLKVDYSLLLIVFLLLAYGLIVLYSASSVQSFQNYGNTGHYIYHQILYGAVLGLLAMFICSKIDYHFWQRNLPILIFFSLLFLALVKIPGIGFSSGGAARWVHVGPIFFQPAELAKMVIILYLASWVDRKHVDLNNFYYGILPSFAIIGLFSLLILWQPDLGTMLVLLLVAFFMLFVAGINWKYFFYSAIVGVLGLYALIKIEPYRVKRLTTFLDLTVDPKGISYQINQAILAIGSGGLWGYGYGLSRQKHNYLPEVMNDSIFAIMSEELGFIRTMLALLLFAAFTVKGYSIAKNAPDTFGKMVAFGITSWIAIQALVNLAAMVNLLPLTGIPLPFFSYGSSALIANLAAIGILLNISTYSHRAKHT
ncbi:MAG TPA: putative lipid II flippase FtsW [Candidatus Limnocylindria bacterium]|nr:putative lipid II flippase FtsW [Candidatus Limnocylindria bacterium]